MNCLVVGRTIDDQRECKALHESAHEPAPTTYLFDDFEHFDGDIITTHTVKYGAVFAAAIEITARVLWTAREHPGKMCLGISELQKQEYISKKLAPNINFYFTDKHDFPVCNSGLFALWLAFILGYERIYTLGLDFVRLTMPNTYNHEVAAQYVKDLEAGKPVNQYNIDQHNQGELDIAVAARMIEQHPGQQVFKAGRISDLPCEVEQPPTKG